ncbi:MAG TPA: hypothetical protein VF100_07350 [Thermoanaerobaculia bacterium]
MRAALGRHAEEVRALRAAIAEDVVARALRGEERYRDPRHLARYEHKVYSQSGEDGIVREVLRRVGVAERAFVEIAAGNGRENNTVFLLAQGWSGLWVEGDPGKVEQIEAGFGDWLASGRLRLSPEFVTAASVGEAMERGGAAVEPDLLSIDIDGNDYWLWKSLGACRARLVVIEYNALFPPDMEWVMPYDPGHRWRRDTWFGASLKSLERLGRELGYRLVGCTFVGTNAFFVREDLVGSSFGDAFRAEDHYQPLRLHLIHRSGFPRHIPRPA